MTSSVHRSKWRYCGSDGGSVQDWIVTFPMNPCMRRIIRYMVWQGLNWVILVFKWAKDQLTDSCIWIISFSHIIMSTRDYKYTRINAEEFSLASSTATHSLSRNKKICVGKRVSVGHYGSLTLQSFSITVMSTVVVNRVARLTFINPRTCLFRLPRQGRVLMNIHPPLLAVIGRWQ